MHTQRLTHARTCAHTHSHKHTHTITHTHTNTHTHSHTLTQIRTHIHTNTHTPGARGIFYTVGFVYMYMFRNTFRDVLFKKKKGVFSHCNDGPCIQWFVPFRTVNIHVHSLADVQTRQR